MAEPSQLLKDYMREHPLSENDMFREAFRNYQGRELGLEIMRLIKAKFFGQYIPKGR